MHCVESCLQKSSPKCQNSIPKSIQVWKPRKGNVSPLDITSPITGSLSHNRSSVLNYNLKILPHHATSRLLKMSREVHGQAIPSIALFPQSGESIVGMLWVSLSCEHVLSQLPPFCFMKTALSGQLPVYFYYQYSPEVISKLTLNCLRASCDLNIWESFHHNTVKGKTFKIH